MLSEGMPCYIISLLYVDYENIQTMYIVECIQSWMIAYLAYYFPVSLYMLTLKVSQAVYCWACDFFVFYFW